MPKPNDKNKRGNAKGGDKPKKHKMPASMIKRGNKREVVFDPDARRAHLRGFSERKRQRRAFGLAMQKVKDRQAKIDQRASQKKEERERLLEAERQKANLMEDAIQANNSTLGKFYGGDKREFSDDGSDSDSDSDDEKKGRKQQHAEEILDTKVYDDQTTEQAWGGQVTVTTSVVELDGDSDDDYKDIKKSKGRNAKNVDTAQKYAGNVEKFMEELRGNMPGKKNRDGGGNRKRKGKDGASDMKGVGGSGNLKIASKLLNKSKDRNNPAGAGNGKKGKRKKR